MQGLAGTAVCTAREARALDAAWADIFGLPTYALMALASRGLADVVRDLWTSLPGAPPVVVVAGAGNNGGDGLVAARWLHGWGVPVTVVLPLGGPQAGDGALALGAAQAAGVPCREDLPVGRVYGVLVDALFGTGLTRDVEGSAADALSAMRAVAEAGAVVVAADLPSGVCADTGSLLGHAVPAAHTVTFGCRKRGLCTGPGKVLAGAVHVVDLGFDGLPDGRAPVSAARSSAAMVRALLPPRAADAHKGRAGHVLVWAGSEAMAGAAQLVCVAALRAGAGLVTLAADAATVGRLGGLPAEVMWRPLRSQQDVAALGRDAAEGRWDAVVCGPGWQGRGGPEPVQEGAWRSAVMTEAVATWKLPMVVDADALPRVAFDGSSITATRVLTPHPGEAGRMLAMSAAAVQRNRPAALAELVARCGPRTAVLLKGAGTLVQAPDRPMVFNPTGCEVLATAGSGDVLSGVIGALLARGLDAEAAAIAGAWLHGMAGDLLAARRGQGWTAGDVAQAIPQAIEALRGPSAAP